MRDCVIRLTCICLDFFFFFWRSEASFFAGSFCVAIIGDSVQALPASAAGGHSWYRTSDRTHHRRWPWPYAQCYSMQAKQRSKRVAVSHVRSGRRPLVFAMLSYRCVASETRLWAINAAGTASWSAGDGSMSGEDVPRDFRMGRSSQCCRP